MTSIVRRKRIRATFASHPRVIETGVRRTSGAMRVSGFTLALFLGAIPLGAQPATEGRIATGVILGAVTDTALRPLAGANASIVLTSARTSGDAHGRFRIAQVPAGNYLVMVRHLGYRPVTTTVAVRENDTARVAFMMEPSTHELEAVNVTAPSVSLRRREFDERRKHGTGEFFDQEQIEARNAVSTIDMLRQVKSVRIEGTFAMSARQYSTCPMQVYVDGIPKAGRTSMTPFDLTELPSPRETMAIEVYAGIATQPIWLPTGPPNGKRSCGVILIWTRDGSATH